MASEAHVKSAPAASSAPPSSRFANGAVVAGLQRVRAGPGGGQRPRPLLERVRFLAIFSINLDEFFQIRSPAEGAVSVGLGSRRPPTG